MERKLATVVFADLVGSTALAEFEDPERTRLLLDRFYEAMAEEVDRAGGTVEKFAGDAVMAAFGAPLALEDHAERALHAALGMRRRLSDLDDRLELRVGVNTGEVVVDRPREGSSFVTGDAVNVAARLEQGAEPGEILVGERAVAAARGAFEFDEEQTIEAKGKRGGVRCRRLLRPLSLMRPRGLGALGATFVGRDAELERLVGIQRETAASGRPGLVTILGDAGVGKTRLIRELWERLGEETPEPLRRTGRCLSYGQGITYWPLAEVLREHFEILESDPPERVRELLGERSFLGLALGLEVAQNLHPLLVRDRFQDAWADFLASLAADRPLVLLVEDAHWADDQLLDLLEHLVEAVDGPLLVLATARPELLDRRPGWSSRGHAQLLELEALSAGDSLRMLEGLLGGELPGRLNEVVVDQAEGNPFFVEELIRTLIDRSLLRRENGDWALGELPPDFSVPDSIQALLAARIDLLEPAEKDALQAASVVGRVFWSGPIYELVEGEPDLRVLEERDFIRRRPGTSMAGEREYAIKHALTREVAYAGLPKAARARLHAAFAAWLERLGEDRDDLASLLAHHYAEAVRPEDADLAWAGAEANLAELRRRAVVWLRRAGELASSRYELDDAVALFSHAIELEEDAAELASLWHALGRAHALRYDERFAEALERAIELTEDGEAKAEMYADLALEGSTRVGMWRERPADEVIEGWIARAIDRAPAGSTALAKALAARAFWSEAGAADDAAEAAEIAARLGEPDLQAMALSARSHVAFSSLDNQEAATWAEAALGFVDEEHNPDLAADTQATALLPSIARGQFREARRLAHRHDELTAGLTSHHRVHGVAVVLEVEELLGAWGRVGELQQRAEESIEANLDTPCVRNARSLFVCALARLNRGEDEEARRLEERAEEVSLEGHGLILDGPRVELALKRGDLERVERLLEKAEDDILRSSFFLASQTALLDGLAALRDRRRVEAQVSPLLQAGTYFEPFALRALGLVREDGELIERALERFEALGLDWHAAETRRLLT